MSSTNSRHNTWSLKDKSQVVKDLKGSVAAAGQIFLATDPDREGEAIAWHLVEATGPDPARVQRVVFHEITPSAVREAMAHPRAIDMRLVDAQQARRVLDRLVGYKVSPLLWRKVKGGLSAGRVQTAALRLIVEREREVEAFVPVEYWTIEADLAKRADGAERRREDQFRATLHQIAGKKAELHTEAEATAVVTDLQGAGYVVREVGGRARRNAAPPRPSSPAPSSRKPPASSATASAARCSSRRNSTRAWTSGPRGRSG